MHNPRRLAAQLGELKCNVQLAWSSFTCSIGGFWYKEGAFSDRLSDVRLRCYSPRSAVLLFDSELLSCARRTEKQRSSR